MQVAVINKNPAATPVPPSLSLSLSFSLSFSVSVCALPFIAYGLCLLPLSFCAYARCEIKQISTSCSSLCGNFVALALACATPLFIIFNCYNNFKMCPQSCTVALRH